MTELVDLDGSINILANHVGNPMNVVLGLPVRALQTIHLHAERYISVVLEGVMVMNVIVAFIRFLGLPLFIFGSVSHKRIKNEE